jgi:hypothetical protein
MPFNANLQKNGEQNGFYIFAAGNHEDVSKLQMTSGF